MNENPEKAGPTIVPEKVKEEKRLEKMLAWGSFI